MDDLSSFAKMWVHNGFVTVNGEKMSKSLGNFLLAHDLVKDYPGEALRLTLLSAHYRQPLDWSNDKIIQSKKMLDRVYKRLDEMKDLKPEDALVPAPILEALHDDLNMPQALAEIHALLNNENSPALKGQLMAIGGLLGILQQTPEQWFGLDANSGIDAAQIENLLAARKSARAAKNFARADEIRKEIEAMGIVIEDTPEGAKWKKA
jgi:cysteinyl-tRNA synthetase